MLSEHSKARIIKAIEAGVLTRREIAEAMNTTTRSVERVVANYRKAHPEWVAPERLLTRHVRQMGRS